MLGAVHPEPKSAELHGKDAQYIATRVQKGAVLSCPKEGHESYDYGCGTQGEQDHPVHQVLQLLIGRLLGLEHALLLQRSCGKYGVWS